MSYNSYNRGYDRQGFVCHTAYRNNKRIVDKYERTCDKDTVAELLRVGKREEYRVYDERNYDEYRIIIFPEEDAHSTREDGKEYRYPFSRQEFFISVCKTKITQQTDDIEHESRRRFYKKIVSTHRQNADTLYDQKFFGFFELIRDKKYRHGNNADDLTYDKWYVHNSFAPRCF
jgi:hypothetical protein